MKNDDLDLYLKDHLAGASGAVEMVDHLLDVYKGQPVASFCEEVRTEISADVEELREMMKALEIKESGVRKAGAWMGEKLSRFKLGLEGEETTGDAGFGLVMETLVLGIKGKELLWKSLAAVQGSWPQLSRFDFARLTQRAVEQGAKVEAKRMAGAAKVFGRNAEKPKD